MKRLWCVGVLGGLLLTQTAMAVTARSPLEGLAVAESPRGVEIVKVSTGSPGAAAGLMAQDIIIELDGHQIQRLEEYVLYSRNALQIVETHIVVRRGRQVHELTITTFSKVLREQWHIGAPVDRELRFVSPAAGFKYWYGEANKSAHQHELADQRQLLINALHYHPDRMDVALRIADLNGQLGVRLWQGGDTGLALSRVTEAVRLYQGVLDRPVDDQQLQVAMTNLRHLLQTLTYFSEQKEGR